VAGEQPDRHRDPGRRPRVREERADRPAARSGLLGSVVPGLGGALPDEDSVDVPAVGAGHGRARLALVPDRLVDHDEIQAALLALAGAAAATASGPRGRRCPLARGGGPGAGPGGEGFAHAPEGAWARSLPRVP